MICPRCRSTNNPEGTKYCLECGAQLPATAAPAANPTLPPQPQPGYAPVPRTMMQPPMELKTSGMAIASLILAIFAPCTFGATGLVGIILGIVAVTQINQPRSGLKGSGLAYAGITVSIVLPLILAAALYPIYSRTKNMVKGPIMASMCMTNLRQVALGAQMYAQDHEGVFPTFDQLYSSSYCTSDKFICPSQPTATIGFGVYQQVPGKKWENFPTPNTTPLLADGGNAGHLITSDTDIAKRHLGGYNQAFLDGHVAANGYNPSQGMPPGAMPMPDSSPAPYGGTH